jgi:hypothetical protein
VIVTGEPVRSTSASSALNWDLASVLDTVFITRGYRYLTNQTS